MHRAKEENESILDSGERILAAGADLGYIIEKKPVMNEERQHASLIGKNIAVVLEKIKWRLGRKGKSLCRK